MDADWAALAPRGDDVGGHRLLHDRGAESVCCGWVAAVVTGAAPGVDRGERSVLRAGDYPVRLADDPLRDVVVGPARSGNLLELVVVEGTEMVIHAMALRRSTPFGVSLVLAAVLLLVGVGTPFTIRKSAGGSSWSVA